MLHEVFKLLAGNSFFEILLIAVARIQCWEYCVQSRNTNLILV